jgi:hypothetical protein
MRTEVKIALGLFAVSTVLKYILSTPDFISGLLLGLSMFFIIIGLLSESTYEKFKEQQRKKLSLLKKLVKLN